MIKLTFKNVSFCFFCFFCGFWWKIVLSLWAWRRTGSTPKPTHFSTKIWRLANTNQYCCTVLCLLVAKIWQQIKKYCGLGQYFTNQTLLYDITTVLAWGGAYRTWMDIADNIDESEILQATLPATLPAIVSTILLNQQYCWEYCWQYLQQNC